VVTPTLHLSQHSLGDFVDCPRRYYLQYVARQPWPLLETGPGGMPATEYREYLRRGVVFHRMVERALLQIADNRTQNTVGRRGMDDGAKGSQLTAQSSELSLWWQHFQSTDLGELPVNRATELALIAPLGDANLYVRYDLLAWDADRAVIVDWKTIRGERAPSQRWFRERLQTRAYLYALASAGAPFNNGQPFAPEQCAFYYWLANFPEQAWVRVGYSRAEFEADRMRLNALAQDIASRSSEQHFPLTQDERHCTYCNYRTLCARAGSSIDGPIDVEADRDYSDAPELEY
jgi:hypothetical protein